MKKVCRFLLIALCSVSMCSCYAFLHADKLVYQGTLGKKMPPVDIQEDTLQIKANINAPF